MKMMKESFLTHTRQNHEILEIWKGTNRWGEVGYFVIARNPSRNRAEFEWGAYYNMNEGYWGHGHYDYGSLATARRDMMSMYKDFDLDLIVKNKLGEY